MATLRLIFAGICLLVLSACVVTPPQVRSIMVNDRVVTEAGTDVQLLRGGAPVPLTPGTTLEPGDEIVTGPDSEAVLVLENGRVEVIVFENTTVRYSSIFLTLGEIYVRVKGRVQDWVGVDSEYVSATPETTEYFVRVGSNDEYACEVLEGRVTLASKGGQWQPVTIRTRDQATARARSKLSRRTLDTTEYNRLINRINKIERVYRPGAAELVAPDVVGKKESDAQKILREHGFGRATVVGVVTKKRAIDEVVTQSPASGMRIRPGAAVRLEVEVKPTSVPNVVGSTLETARRALERADLKIGSIGERLEIGADPGIVRSQSVAAKAEVVPGTEIDLVVSEKGAKVPSLKGLTLSKARTVLRNANLVLGDDTKQASSATVNTIIDQNPDPNDIVRVNSEVDVVLAEKEVRYCTVPDVRGLTPSDASSRITSAGFKATSKGSGSYVWGERPTEPAAGTSRPCGSWVTINLVIG